MGKKNKSAFWDKDIIKATEDRLALQNVTNEDVKPPDEKKLLHGLLVHHIELEMQNEELQTAQLELNEVRDRYFDLYNLAPIGYLNVNEKGIIEEANLTAAKFFDLGKVKLLKQPLSRFILEEDLNIFSLHQKKLLDTKEKQQFELRMKTTGGEILHTHLTSVLMQDKKDTYYNSITITDISERKQAEDKIKVQKQILNAISQAILITDGKGIISYSNCAATEIFGWSEEEIKGRKIHDIITEPATTKDNVRFSEAERQGSLCSGKKIMVRKDGHTFTAMVKNLQVDNSDDITDYIFVVSAEITKRKTEK